MILRESRAFNSETAIKNTIGFAVHAEETKKALKRQGIRFANDERGVKPDVIFHQSPAHLIKKVNGFPNILYTAWESPNIPQEYLDAAKDMDLIIGNSKFSIDPFKKGLPDMPTAVCPLGIDPIIFPYKKRTKLKADKPIIFLFVGAPNPRKGMALLQQAWKPFSGSPKCILYVKTTGRGQLEQAGNVVVDSRKLKTEELAQLYQKADCFIFPSYGEGFGLPLIEAMATGLPCIYTKYGGVKEFCGGLKSGFPLKHDMVEIDYGVRTIGAQARPESITTNMNHVWNTYSKALKKGERASENIHNNFTWDCSGIKMKKILVDFMENYNG